MVVEREGTDPTTRVVGRSGELADLRRFVAASARGPGALVLSGAAGAGKTTLWEAGCALARQQGRRVLATRARDAEASLSFVGIGDLLDGVDRAVIDALPGPQRAALDIVLLEEEPGDAQPAGPRALGVALLNVVRVLAADAPVLVAVDDAQWLDPETASALAFVGRRVGELPVRLLAAERLGAGTPFAAPEGARRLTVGPLGSGSLARMLRERLGLRLRRSKLQELERMSQGNPLFALEVGRVLVRDGVPGPGEPLPQPGVVDDLIAERLAALPADVRRALLSVALSGDPRRSELAALLGEEALDAATATGVLAADGDRLRAAHPLLAAAAVTSATPRQRRAVHADLAGSSTDEFRSARHRALAATRAEEALADDLGVAAARALARRSAADAAALAEQALRLTPARSPHRAARVMTLAVYLERAGSQGRMTELLRTELDGLPAPARARAYLMLCEGADVLTAEAFGAHIDLALAEAPDDPAVRVKGLARRVELHAIGGVRNLRDAEAWALEAVEQPGEVPAVDRHEALQALAWARALRGLPIDDLTERQALLDPPGLVVYRTLNRIALLRTAWRGDLDAARDGFHRLGEEAESRGEYWSQAAVALHLVEIDLRAGACDAVAAGMEAPDLTADQEIFLPPIVLRCSALLAAMRGDRGEAGRLAAEAVTSAELVGMRWDILFAGVADGLGALAGGDAAHAARALGEVWRYTCDEEIDEPGAFPVAPDLVEALVALDRRDEADAVLARLADLSERQEHPWGRISVRRCHALLQLARRREEDAAVEDLGEAAAAYGRLGLHHDAARTLLALGRAQRRRRKWGDARAALERAAAAFTGLGAGGWAAVAGAELERVGARRPPSDPDALTPAERRVALLAAAGHSNKEIAQALVVTVSTVEAHLSRSYAKLGVRSRTQLAQRLGA